MNVAIVIGFNQADFAMKCNNFNIYRNEPSYELEKFLIDKKLSVKKRLKDSIGLESINIIEYSAITGYSIDRFLDLIIDNIPRNKRLLGYYWIKPYKQSYNLSVLLFIRLIR